MTSKDLFPKSHWPLLTAVGGFVLLVAAMVLLSMERCRGYFGPVVDDAFIQMAMAKNLAEHGVWGVNRWEFSSASSSFLWPPLLALCYALGWRGMFMPFGLNLIAAAGLLWVAHHRLRPLVRHPGALLPCLLVVVFATPLPMLAFIEMEHTLQALLFVSFVVVAASVLSVPPRTRVAPIRILGLALLGAAACAIRYESLFVTTLVCGLLAWRRRLNAALLVAATSALPLLIFGWYSHVHGGYWLPNSVLVKGNRPAHLHSFGDVLRYVTRPYRVLLTWRGAVSGVAALSLVPGLGLAWLLRLRRHGFWEGWQLVAVLTVFGVVCHLQFAYISLRYGAYLVASAVLLLMAFGLEQLPRLSLGRSWRASWTAALPLVFIAPALAKGTASTFAIPAAVQPTYEIEYPIGLLLRDHYSGSTVLVGELGAPSYLGDIRCVDLFGLGSVEITRLMLEGRMNASTVAALPSVRAATVAVVPDTLKRFLGPDWIEVGSWTVIPYGQERLRWRETFFGHGETAADSLRVRFRRFSGGLSPNVEVTTAASTPRDATPGTPDMKQQAALSAAKSATRRAPRGALARAKGRSGRL